MRDSHIVLIVHAIFLSQSFDVLWRCMWRLSAEIVSHSSDAAWVSSCRECTASFSVEHQACAFASIQPYGPPVALEVLCFPVPDLDCQQFEINRKALHDALCLVQVQCYGFQGQIFGAIDQS